LGWIVGDMQQERTPRAGMWWGACGGALVGFGLALAQLVVDSCRVVRSGSRQERAEPLYGL
jgi:hypothetical protein